MRCPACGARNVDHADWCTQCYADLRPGPEPVEVDPGQGPLPLGADRDPGAVDAVPTAHTSAPGTPSGDAAARDVRTVDGEVEWRCGACDGWNRLEVARCGTCGTPRHGFGDVAPPPRVEPSARTRLAVASALLPGLGHLLARRTGTGVARVVLALTWAVGAVVVVRAADGAGIAPALPLVVGFVLLWAGSVHDVLALADEGPELLTGRVLAWLTGAVSATLLVVLLVVAGGRGPT